MQSMLNAQPMQAERHHMANSAEAGQRIYRIEYTGAISALYAVLFGHIPLRPANNHFEAERAQKRKKKKKKCEARAEM